ncbi:MAG: PAS domain S-box protein [Rhodocyclaceae bacterium]|nr:PAS domain S-box protein [Rhodocyclaceae bacterium]MBX3670235.1 PAS domain S-box protein [Rhodocyclaceae bacterium]
MFRSALGRSEAILNSEFVALAVVKDRAIIWGNRAFHQTFGYEPDELISQPTCNLFPDELSHVAFERAANAAIDESGRFHAELRLQRKSGDLGWFDLNMSRLDGSEHTFVATLVDRTESRQAVEKLALQVEILSAITDAVNVVSADGIIRFTNRACDAMFGYAEGELVGRHASVLNAETERSPQQVAQEIMQSLDASGGWRGDLLNRRKDGSTFWTNAQVISHRSAGLGQVWISVQRDISAQREAQAALRASEERYRTMVVATSVVTWRCPPSGLNTSSQPVWEAFTGQSAEQLLGAGWAQAVHPADMASVADAWQSALQSGQPFANEFRIRRHDGAWRWMSMRAVPVIDGAGCIVEWSGMGHDVTERKEAELALQDNEERLEMALDGSGLALWDWHLATHEVLGDKRWHAILGYQPDELGLAEENWWQLVDPRDLAALKRRLTDHFNGETASFHSEHRLRHKEGHWIHVEARGKITERDAAGQPLRMVGTALDISQRKRLNEEGVNLLKQIETLIRDATDGAPRSKEQEDLAASLTRRERQILGMIASGMTSAQIGEHLHLATNTIVSHRRNLMAKLDLHSTAEVTRFAMDHGLTNSR